MVKLIKGQMKRPQMTFRGKCFDGQSCDRELIGCDDESHFYMCRHGDWDDPKENAPCEPKKYYSDSFDDHDDDYRKKKSCKPKSKRKIVKKSKRK